MKDEFYTADIPDKEYEENKSFAIGMYKAGAPPTFSSGICETLTAGYGRLDGYGYWEFPLPVNQETGKIEVHITEEF